MYDLALTNAHVITMDPKIPTASLVAVRGERIAVVLGEAHHVSILESAKRSIDCGGKTLMPGFIDAHGHVYAYAENLVSLNLSPQSGVGSIQDLQDRIRDFCHSRPPGTWVRGKGYNEYYIAEGRHPHRWDLDAAAPHHPVKLTHRSGHAHVLNSLALREVGITAETEDPQGGFIDRDLPTGEPTGILYGMGEFLSARIPSAAEEEIEKGLSRASETLLACGVTSVQDASYANDETVLHRFGEWRKRGLFKPRIRMMRGWNAFAKGGQDASQVSDSDIAGRGVKIMLGSTTGAMHPSQGELNERVEAIHVAGRQAVIHAIEEPEIEAACNAIAHCLRKWPRRDPRHRIEHCSVCTPALAARMSELGVFVVTQPSFAYFSGDRYLNTVPREQLVHLYAIGSMTRHGVRIGFGSDFPIADPNPMIGIQAAVTRRTEGGAILLEEERISVGEALRAYMAGAAEAGFEEEAKGSIEAGKLADLVLLSDDPHAVDPGRIKDIRVLMTIIGGRVVWSCVPGVETSGKPV